ncbi:hypothetical protein ABFA25_03410 [Mycobacterium lepromatosis]
MDDYDHLLYNGYYGSTDVDIGVLADTGQTTACPGNRREAGCGMPGKYLRQKLLSRRYVHGRTYLRWRCTNVFGLHGRLGCGKGEVIID